VGVAGFRAVRVVLMQNSFQLSPLLRMKLVISRKAWYVTTCWRGMVLGWEEIQGGDGCVRRFLELGVRWPVSRINKISGEAISSMFFTSYFCE
jgi:hypothetical protein